MKKIAALLLVVCMVLAIAGCSKPESTTQNPKETTPVKTDETKKPDSDNPMANKVAIILQEGGLGDKGYNDGAKAGFDQMVEKYGIDGVLVEATAASEADTFIRTLANEGYPLIICLDWVIIDYVKAASADYPDTKFVVLGKGLPGPGTQENLIEPFTALHEWAAMATIAMIELSKDENVMFDWQMNNPGITIGTINPGESVNQGRSRSAEQQIIQWYKDNEGLDVTLYNDYTGSYTDSALNMQIAENMFVNQGVEALWPVLGTGALATFTTGKQNGAYVLGCDSFQDDVEPGIVATSVLHNTTAMVTNIITEWQEGTLKGTNEYYWGVESGVVGLTDMSYVGTVEGCNQEVWAKIQKNIKAWEDRIISGEFIIYNFFLEQEFDPNAGEFENWQKNHPGVDYTEWVKGGRK